MLHLKHGATFGIMDRTEKWVTFGKMCHTLKYGIHFKKMVALKRWATPSKLDNTVKNGSHYEKWVTYGKMCHTKNGSSCEKKSHFEKFIGH